MIDTLFFDIYDDLSSEGLPRYVIVEYIIKEAGLQLKPQYEVEEIMNNCGNGPADVFGYCVNMHSHGDFQEAFPTLRTIIPYLLVYSWYPNSIFSRTPAAFPTNVLKVVTEALTISGDSHPIERNRIEEITEIEREELDAGSGDNSNIEYIIISDEE
ncbi:hypothetical protein BDC45DRAFT_598567 [Circinella umbellata]|nr:hypothetical protein BDC45DRAFT_598567 [Circinella umbellata]